MIPIAISISVDASGQPVCINHQTFALCSRVAVVRGCLLHNSLDCQASVIIMWNFGECHTPTGDCSLEAGVC